MARGHWDQGNAAQQQVKVETQAIDTAKQQNAGVLKAETRYIHDVKVIERRIPVFNRELMSRCLRGSTAEGAGPAVSGHAGGAAPDGAGDDDAGWCRELAADYHRGQLNTAKLHLLRAAVIANGGAGD